MTRRQYNVVFIDEWQQQGSIEKRKESWRFKTEGVLADFFYIN